MQEAAHNEIAELCRGDGRADRLDRAAELMPDRRRAGHGGDAAVAPQVGTTDAGSDRAKDGVGGFDNGRIGTAFVADVLRCVNDSSIPVAKLITDRGLLGVTASTPITRSTRIDDGRMGRCPG